MKGASVKKKTHLVNDAGEAETAVETVGVSGKRSGGDGGFGSEDGGGGSGESILPEMGDDMEEEDDEEEDEEEEEEEERGEGREERSKLDEGYFEIEAIRRKRVRKVSSFSSSSFGKCGLRLVTSSHSLHCSFLTHWLQELG